MGVFMIIFLFYFVFLVIFLMNECLIGLMEKPGTFLFQTLSELMTLNVLAV